VTTPHPVAVVSGASSGIGRAVVELLIREGWSVAALDRDETGLASLVESAKGRAVACPTDVSKSVEVDAAYSQARAALGPIQAVVAAAGIWTPGTVEVLSDEQWDRAIAVNLTGMFNTARASVNHLLESGGGAFVAVASDVGVQGSQNCAPYVVAKHGVVGLVRSMALDFGARGIRSNAICPGFVNTAMTEEIFRNSPPELVRARNSEVPLGRFASPAEIAEVISSVIGPGFSFVNGTALLVDGGATAGYYTP
jgi:meso-butanediol dehydrogenase/(S,S)-butanediol dehydrogenase/diacetyl reductase